VVGEGVCLLLRVDKPLWGWQMQTRSQSSFNIRTGLSVAGRAIWTAKLDRETLHVRVCVTQ
jgi:hypothetical protein